MAVYYKFKSAKDYDSFPIEGQFISVANLKERIFESKHLGRGTDFDLMVSNAQTNEEYADGAMIPKNTSVLIRRVPGRPRMTIVTEPDEPKAVENKVEELQPSSSTLVGNSSTTRYPDETEWDEFGNDLYAIPEVTPAQPSNPVVIIPPANKVDEDSKIKALVDTSALDWNRQTQDAYGSGRGFGRGMGGRMMGGRGFGRGGFERTMPPAGYICHRCKVPGHFIQHCPTNGDPTYDLRKVRPPTGIPKSMLLATPDGSYALPSGAVAVLKPNEAAFEKEIEGLPSTRPIGDIPPELCCPLCKEVMKDAVLTSKCCFRSFCDKCIRDYIISKSMCVCGVANVLADDLLPNRTVRETISRILESTNSSTENAGSFLHVPDMESARNVQPKPHSPILSAASKDEFRLPPKDYSLGAKEAEGASEGKPANFPMHSLDKKTTDPSEPTPESANGKEPIAPENAPMPEETQERLLAQEQGKKKKKKKMRIPGSAAADMQWRAFPDFGAESFSGMPLAPSPFNPYWSNGMPMGMEGYMTPFSGAMPYMGFPTGPYDAPFGGVLPQDPFAAQGYMMPGLPQRDLSELGMGMNRGSTVMSREEFEARKADLRRKRGLDRLNEREHLRDRGREVSSSADAPPAKTMPRLLSQAATADRHDRSDRPDRDRRAPSRDSSRHSPPRPRKRRSRSPDRDAAGGAGGGAAPADAAKEDRKHKGSVFSRISFPEGGSKKRKAGSDSPKEKEAAVANGHHERDRDRDDWKPGKGSSSTGGRRGGPGYERESSEEEHHFKRRPSSSSSSRREAAEREEDGRASKGTRDREHKRR